MKISIAIFFLITNAILADMITLKNGQVLVGRYLSEDDRKIKFQVFTEIKTISKSDISNFELGYSGVPVCYQIQNKWGQNCGDVVHLLDKNKMVLGKGEGLLEKEEFPMKDLKQVSLKKSRKDEKIFYILRPGIDVTIQTNGQTVSGEIQSVTSDTISIKAGKESLVLKELDVEEVSWQAPKKMSFSGLRYSVPGFFQVQEGNRFKGALIGFLFLGFAGGIGAEYVAAQKALNKDMDIIIINDSIYVGSNIFPNKSYANHVRGMNFAIAGLTLVTLYHSYEVYSHVSPSGLKATIHMQIPYLDSHANRTNLFQSQQSTGIEFRISYSF